MFGIIYKKSTGKIRNIIRPQNKKEEDFFNGSGPLLLPDEAFMLIGEELNGVPNVNKLQVIVNEKLKI